MVINFSKDHALACILQVGGESTIQPLVQAKQTWNANFFFVTVHHFVHACSIHATKDAENLKSANAGGGQVKKQKYD